MKREFTNINEENQTIEFNPSLDNVENFEIAAIDEVALVNEAANDEQESKDNSRETRKKRDISSFMSSTLTAAVASVVVGVTTLLNVNMNASMAVSDYDFPTGNLAYSIEIENMSENESLSLYLYKDGELIEEREIVDEGNDGIEEGFFVLDKESIDRNLEENTNYKTEYEMKLIGVVGLDVEREFDSYKTVIEKHTAEIYGVSMECKCAIDGYFHFQIDYDDPMDALTDFEAYIIGDNGTVRSDCVFTEDYHEEQKIYVSNIIESNAQIYISYVERGTGERVFLTFDNGNIEKDNYKEITL